MIQMSYSSDHWHHYTHLQVMVMINDFPNSDFLSSQILPVKFPLCGIEFLSGQILEKLDSNASLISHANS